MDSANSEPRGMPPFVQSRPSDVGRVARCANQLVRLCQTPGRQSFARCTVAATYRIQAWLCRPTSYLAICFSPYQGRKVLSDCFFQLFRFLKLFFQLRTETSHFFVELFAVVFG